MSPRACRRATGPCLLDAEAAGDRAALAGLGDRALVARAKEVAYRLDAACVVRRARKAESERCVSVRPAPDTMTYLTGLLPVAQGVGVYAALTRAADTARAQGDPRTRGQIMADTLVERVTGQDEAAGVGVEVQVVMTDRALLAGQEEPATIPGYGTVPAAWVRRLVHQRLTCARDGGPAGRVPVWVRRLFTHPATGQLIAVDSRRRTAPPGLARFVDVRDQTCRTPWCDAPIRHRDHISAHADGGPHRRGEPPGPVRGPATTPRPPPAGTPTSSPTSKDEPDPAAMPSRR